MDSVRDGPEASPGRGDCPPARSAHEGSGDRYRWLVEQSVDVIAELDGDGIIRFANPAVERVLGYRPEELLGTSGFALIHLDDLPKTREAFADLLQHPGVSGPQFAFRGRHKDGAWRHLEAQGKHVTRDSTQSGIVFCLRDVTAHTQAEAALAARTRQLETVRRVSEEIARELELSTLLGLITRRAKDLIGASMGMIRLWDAAREELVPFAWDGVGEWLVHKALRLGEDVAGTAAQRREGLIVNDFRCSSYATPLHLKRTTYTAVLAEPLLYRAQLVGVLALAREDGAAFTLDQQEVLRLFATQAAIAIQNARLFEAEQQRREQLEAVRVVSAEITRELDLDRLLDLILHRAIDLVGGTAGVILLWDEVNQRLIPQAQCGELAAVTRHPIPPGEGMIGRVAATKTGLRINDYPNWEGAHPELQPLGLVAGIAEPLLFHDKLIGVVNIATADKQKRFSEQDNTLLRLLADQAAIAIENARLYQQEQMRRKELEAVRSVSEEITREMDLTALLRLILARAVELAAGDTGVLYLWSEDTQRLIPQNWHGYGEWVADVRLRLEEGVSGTVAARREGLIVNDFRASPYATPLWLGRSRQVAALSEPLLYRARLVGVITIAREDPHCPFTAEDQRLLRLFAIQAAIALENAQLHAAAVRRGDELETLLAATRSVMSGLDLQKILDRVVAEAHHISGAPHVKILLLDRPAGLLRVGAARGTAHAPGETMPLDSGTSALVARSGEPLYIAQCAEDPRNHMAARDRTLGMQAYLGLPITRGTEVLGVLTFNTTTPKTFSPAELAYLTAFADQAAIAIENARLFQAEQQRREQLEAVRVVSAEIARELDLDRLLDLILRRAMELAGAEAGVIMLWDEAAQALFPRLRLGEFWAKMPVRPIPLGEGIVGHVAQTRQGLIINEYRAWAGARQLALAQTAITAALGEPLLYRDQLIGAISLIHTGGRRVFEAHHGALLRLFADQAAIAIQNAQLHAAAMRRSRELEALVVAMRSVMSGLDLQEILDHILNEAAKMAGTAHVRVALVEREARVLRVARVTGDLVAPGFAYPLEGSLSGLVVTKGEPIFSANADSDPQSYFGPRYRELGIVTFLGLPIKSGGEVLGVLIFNTSTPRQYSAEELTYLTSFATQAAIALENARLYEAAQRALADLQRTQAELVRAEKLRGLGQMAAGIAHDLNNMLAAILGQVELLKLRGAPPEVREGLATLETAASDGAAVVRRLQDFARQRAALPLAPMDLGQAVHEALELTRPRWQDELHQRGKTIGVHLALGDLPSILGHASEIREALTNLIFNAVDAMPDGGRLTLVGAATPTEVALALTDTGVGMPEAVRQKIFEPFFTTKGVKGTGLGLAVVYSILERHGGRVAVASAPGQGTTVTLIFQAATQEVPAPPPAPGHLPAARRLLLIDDELAVRTTLGTLLRAVGHEVIEAASGPAGLALLAAHPVDLVITDLGMPDMTGWEVAQQVKAAHPHLPVILLTGWGQQAPPPTSGQACVDRVLGKPIRLDDLRAAIAALTGPGDSPHPAA